MYLPELVIYHYISESRLTREYYRSWCFWRGVSRGLMDQRHPMPVKYLGGVPRYLWGRAARAMVRLASPRSRAANEKFGDELRMWDVWGFFYGRHLYPLARFSPVRSRRTTDAIRPGADKGETPESDNIEIAG
jgi:hypothetical protein